MLDVDAPNSKGETSKETLSKNCQVIGLNFRLLDSYLIGQFLPAFIFSVAICTIFGELIGITFEQIQFIAFGRISPITSLYVHVLKLPAFFSIGLPFALLLAALILYSNLSYKKEIIALQSVGICLWRLAAPILLAGIIATTMAFVFHEFVVPPANYRAALLLEQAWGVDRTELAKYNKREIFYLQFDDAQQASEPDFIFFAHRFNGKQMQGVTLLEYSQQRLQEIIVAETAEWDAEMHTWKIQSGHQYQLRENGSYAQISSFSELPLTITKNILDYANHLRDPREMNILQLYQRLNVIQNTDNLKEVHRLRMGIQERYALPFSCLVFTMLGISIGMKTALTSRANSFGIAAAVIFLYYIVQFISNAMIMAEVLPVTLGIWLPNILGGLFGYYLVRCRQTNPKVPPIRKIFEN